MDLVASAFGLGDVVTTAVVARGAMGQISRVETSTGRYAVKELFPWNPGDGVDVEIAVTARARAGGVAVPREVTAPGGEVVVAVGAARFRVYEWFDLGSHDSYARRAGEVGRLLRSLHDQALPTGSGRDPWYDSPPAPDRWGTLARSWGGALPALVPELVALGEVRRRSVAPLVLCHRDLNPDNVLPFGDALAVLDWENVGPLEKEQELGYVLHAWCVEGARVDQAAVAALLDGYGEGRGDLGLHSFATAATTWLSFLAVQAELALDPDADRASRAFAHEQVGQALQAPLTSDLLRELAAATA